MPPTAKSPTQEQRRPSAERLQEQKSPAAAGIPEETGDTLLREPLKRAAKETKCRSKRNLVWPHLELAAPCLFCRVEKKDSGRCMSGVEYGIAQRELLPNSSLSCVLFPRYRNLPVVALLSHANS